MATFPPFGMKLAILEVRLLLSASSVSSFASSTRTSGVEARFTESLTLLFSFSGALAELFLAVSARLNVLCAMPFSAIFGLLAVVALAPGRTLPSSTSSGSVFEDDSDNFKVTLFSGEDLDALLLLNNLSFSSIDLCDATLGGASHVEPFLAPEFVCAGDGLMFLLLVDLLLQDLLVALG